MAVAIDSQYSDDKLLSHEQLNQVNYGDRGAGLNLNYHWNMTNLNSLFPENWKHLKFIMGLISLKLDATWSYLEHNDKTTKTEKPSEHSHQWLISYSQKDYEISASYSADNLAPFSSENATSYLILKVNF